MCSKNNCCCKKKKTTKAKARARPVRKAYLPYSSPVPNIAQPLTQFIPSAVSQVSMPIKNTAEMGTQTESLVKKNLPALKSLISRETPKVQIVENQTRGRQIVKNILQTEERPNRGFSVVREGRPRSESRKPMKATNVPQFIQALEARQPPKNVIARNIPSTPSVKKEQIKRKPGRPKKELIGSIIQLNL